MIRKRVNLGQCKTGDVHGNKFKSQKDRRNNPSGDFNKEINSDFGLYRWKWEYAVGKISSFNGSDTIFC